MKTKFKVGDKVSWNSEAGRVSGTIIKYILKILTTKTIRIMLLKMTRNMKSEATRPTTSLLIKETC